MCPSVWEVVMVTTNSQWSSSSCFFTPFMFTHLSNLQIHLISMIFGWLSLCFYLQSRQRLLTLFCMGWHLGSVTMATRKPCNSCCSFTFKHMLYSAQIQPLSLSHHHPMFIYLRIFFSYILSLQILFTHLKYETHVFQYIINKCICCFLFFLYM